MRNLDYHRQKLSNCGNLSQTAATSLELQKPLSNSPAVKRHDLLDTAGRELDGDLVGRQATETYDESQAT